MNKRIRLTMVVLSIFSITAVFAQGGEQMRSSMTPEQRADKTISRMDETLKLSQEQKTNLKQIYTASFTKEQGYRQEANGDHEKFRSLAADNRKATAEKVNSILTKEQQQQWEKAKSEEKGQWQGRN